MCSSEAVFILIIIGSNQGSKHFNIHREIWSYHRVRNKIPAAYKFMFDLGTGLRIPEALFHFHMSSKAVPILSVYVLKYERLSNPTRKLRTYVPAILCQSPNRLVTVDRVHRCR